MAHSAHWIESEDPQPNYLSRLTRTPLLTAEQEKAIMAEVKKGCPNARHRLIEANLRLVINIARTYRSQNISLEDLIQEGIIGLAQASERYDPEKGRFSTYATFWIRQAIGRAVDGKAKAIRLPAHIAQSLRKIERERLRLVRELGVEPTQEQLATALGITSGKLVMLLQASKDMLSLDMTVGDGHGTTLGAMLQDMDNLDPESHVISEETREELRRILSKLNDREQKVMNLRFRLDGSDEPIQADDVAKEMQISRERVRQIEIQAIKKLRAMAHRRKMRETLG